MRVLLLGPPASGKGTQARRMAALLGVETLGTGALLRGEIARGSELGRLAEPILARGEYLPDDLMCRILAKWLEEHPGGWLLDGFPRSVPQAEFLDNWLARRGGSIDRVILLTAPFEALLGRIRERVECPSCRWSGGRAETKDMACPECGTLVRRRDDDSEENFRKRYDEYCRLTIPVADHYRRHGLLGSCDATAPRDAVWKELQNLLSGPISPL